MQIAEFSGRKPAKLYNPAQMDLRVPGLKKKLVRAVVEVAFIILLFYANLLMGEFERSGVGYRRGLLWAIEDVFTFYNFAIALAAAIAGHFIFDGLRKLF
jgi:hypothetical protein